MADPGGAVESPSPEIVAAGLRVSAITPGVDVPSARYRVRQLVPELRAHGVFLDELVPSVSAYPPKSVLARPLWGALALAARIPLAASTWRYQLTMLQREMISTMVTLESWTRAPRVLDVDDAIFLHRDGRTADRIARMCESVVCGNEFLAEWFRPRSANLIVLPTAVDTARYAPPNAGRDPEARVLGWVGTSANLPYLRSIEDALATVLAADRRAALLVVSDERPRLPALPADRVEFCHWSPDAEKAALDAMSLGLMPLEDSPWARGKCSYKMLLYMAAGLPVVASPVGMNAEIFALGPLGIPARSQAEWRSALTDLLADPDARRSMGSVGRTVVEERFSVARIAPRLADHLLRIAGIRGREGP